MILKGKVFISTVSAHKSVEIRNIFEPLGAVVIDFPMTEIAGAELTPEIQDAINSLEKFHWIIFTSANGVKHFFQLVKNSGSFPSLPLTVKIAAVGIKTASELEKEGMKVHFTGSGNTAEELANELIRTESLQNCNILLPLGNLAPDTLQNKLSGIAHVMRINVYNTMKADAFVKEPVDRIINNLYDLVLFTSPSGVEYFIDQVHPENLRHTLRAASIGAVTTKAAERLGFPCLLTATRSTYEGLADEIVNYYTLNKQ